jgi:hypothetical protein
MNPTLSVAVPTHNRARYAIHAILSLLSIDADDLEVVVTDTSTTPDLHELLHGPHRALLADRRLRYVQPAERLDMTGNHNAALALTTGDYVCLIGDDDTISKEALSAARWARQRGIDVIAPNVMANYVWPDFESRHFGMRHARRMYLARNMGAMQTVDSRDALATALAHGAQGTDGLPKIYHGLVRRSLLDEIKQRAGAYFHGSSPDVSGAIGLASVSSTFLVVDYPLTVPGASGGSNTGRSAMNKHKGKLSAEAQTMAFGNKGWSAGVPRFFSVETVWAHAAIETLARLEPSRIAQFNFVHLIAACRALHGEYRDEIEAAAVEAGAIVGMSAQTFWHAVRRATHRFNAQRALLTAIRLRVPTPAGGRDFVDALDNVAEAPPELYLYLQRRGRSWERLAAAMA